MGVLALGGTGAALATAWMETSTSGGIALAVLSFVLIGIGVGASGTNLLALLATRVVPQRRAPAATIVWMMMIAGLIITAIVAGKALDPYSGERLVAVTSIVCALAFLLAVASVWNVGGARGGGGRTRREILLRRSVGPGVGRTRGTALHHFRLRVDAGL